MSQTVKCKICEKNFTIKNSHLLRRKTCSKECFKKYLSVKYLGRNNPNTKYMIDDNFFEEINLNEKAYLLGWIASDGHIKDNGFSVSIHKNDAKNIFNLFDDILNIKNNQHKKLLSDCITYTINSKKIADDLCKHLKLPFSKNTKHKKSNIVQFPELNSDKLKWMFIRGYFEGDGHVNKPSINNRIPKCAITSSSKDILESIKEFTKIPCSLYNDRESYKIEFNGLNAIDFLGQLYDDCQKLKLNRKYENYEDWLTWKPSLPGYNRVDKFIFTKTRKDAVIPKKSRPTDVGYDITIIGIEKEFGDTKLYNTGIKIKVPYGYYLDLVPRSSIIKTGYIQANSIGIIDPTYSGEILVALTKLDKNMPDLQLPLRIGQLIPREIVNIEFIQVDSLDELHQTSRGKGGFGSTGK